MVESLIQMMANIGKFVGLVKKTGSYYQTSSLADATKITRVEPILVISRDMVNSEYLSDITKSLVNIFSAYFLQAFNLTSGVNSVRVVKTLDRLNPDRDASGFLIANESLSDHATMAAPFYQYRLPAPGGSRISTEDDGGLLDTILNMDSREQVNGQTKAALIKDQQKELGEISNLAVGKLITVSFNNGEEKGVLEIPITVRLAPVMLSNLAITKILAMKTEDNTFIERYHSWRAGRINFIRDLIFCQDLIDESKKLMMDDTEGIYSEIIKRANNSKKYGLLTANPSLVSASNLFIISEEVAKDIEEKLGGKLSNPKIIKKAFENTYAMIIVVVDREWERATFYTRNISTSANFSIKELKSANKDKGIDVMDVLKSFTHGNSPSF